MTTQHPNVTVLGLGPMGTAVATALVDAGLPTTVWNRTESRTAPLRDRGATVASSAEEAVRGADVVLTVLRDPAATREVLAAVPDDALAGSTVVSLATSTPDEARTTADWADRRGIAWLSGAIMVPTPVIGTDDALVLYAGPPLLFEHARTALEALGGTADHVGDEHGRASLLDSAMLEVFFAGMTAFLHGAALVTAQGLSAADFLPYGRVMVGLLGPTFDGLARDVDAGRYPGDEDTVAMDLSALEHVARAGQEVGLDPRLPDLLRQLAVETVAAGHAEHGWSSVVETMRKS
jgi:3-hydroxyisobutyrate dehydrogenase-like beta-hydroxyacid dehydrogenase